jgi:polysaccharide export outer membrane protein
VALVCWLASGLAAGAAQPASPNYVIGANDRLKIAVWNQENMSGEYVVAGDGSFSFPLIGRVVANGLTLEHLEAELQRRLSAGYFRNPQVTITVAEYRSRRVHVMGAVRQPGTYPLTGETGLIEALARAGSTTAEAADHVFIIPPTDGREPVSPAQVDLTRVTRVDLRGLDGGQLPTAVSLHDGETVYVPRALTVYVYGQVRSPGSYAIGQETTVRQALALAGGVSDFGAVNRIRVLRKDNHEQREIKVGLNDILKAGDTLVVPERYF